MIYGIHVAKYTNRMEIQYLGDKGLRGFPGLKGYRGSPGQHGPKGE